MWCCKNPGCGGLCAVDSPKKAKLKGAFAWFQAVTQGLTKAASVLWAETRIRVNVDDRFCGYGKGLGAQPKRSSGCNECTCAEESACLCVAHPCCLAQEATPRLQFDSHIRNSPLSVADVAPSFEGCSGSPAYLPPDGPYAAGVFGSH